MEVLGSLPGIRMIGEPFNVRVPRIASELDIYEWHQLFEPTSHARLQRYLERIQKNELRFLNPNPFVQWRFFTNRTLYRIIHLPAHLAEGLAASIGGKFICLVRHPIPVSLSRKVFPILDDFIDSAYRDTFNSEKLKCADQVIANGSYLEKGVLAWCLHFEPFLRGSADRGSKVIFSYEECVANTLDTLTRMESCLGEKFPKNIRAKALAPSRVLSKSDAETQALLNQRKQSPDRVAYLTSRWQSKVSHAERLAVQEILNRFEISLYRSDDPFPREYGEKYEKNNT